MTTRAFIEGLQRLSRYAECGEDSNILHAEREEIWIYVRTDLPQQDLDYLRFRGFTVNEEFDCWRYYASL